MAEEGADLFTQALSADISQQLEAGHEVSYTAISSEAGFAAARVAGGEDQVEAGQIVVDDSGVYGERFLATKEGFAVVAMEANEDGVTVAGLAATAEDEEASETPAAT